MCYYLEMKGSEGLTTDSISFYGKIVKVLQKRDGYRFAIDALLLADFVKAKAEDNIIDLGTGTGIIALLLASRFPSAKVTGIELQKSLFLLAQRNVKLNRFDARAFIERLPIADTPMRFKRENFDCIVSNPPYRRLMSGRINPEEEKAIARHELKTSLEEIIRAGEYLLNKRGRLYLIYLPERLTELIYHLKRYMLEPKRIRPVYSREGEDAVFILIEAVKAGREGMKIERPLYIYDKSGDYTEDVKKIYGRETD